VERGWEGSDRKHNILVRRRRELAVRGLDFRLNLHPPSDKHQSSALSEYPSFIPTLLSREPKIILTVLNTPRENILFESSYNDSGAKKLIKKKLQTIILIKLSKNEHENQYV
jgi:hypothetical protein